jgi:hypothetical protein
MASFTNYATVSMADSHKLSVIHEQLNKPRRFRIKYWNKTNQDAIVITYREVWIDDGGHTHENYRNAVVDKKHDVIFQLRAKFEGLKNER